VKPLLPWPPGGELLNLKGGESGQKNELTAKRWVVRLFQGTTDVWTRGSDAPVFCSLSPAVVRGQEEVLIPIEGELLCRRPMGGLRRKKHEGGGGAEGSFFSYSYY